MMRHDLGEVATMAADTVERLLAEAGSGGDGAFDPRLWELLGETGIAGALGQTCHEKPDDEAALGLAGALNLFSIAAAKAAPVPLVEHGFATWAMACCGLDEEGSLVVPAGLGVSDEIAIGDDGTVSGTAHRVAYARHADRVVVFSRDRVAACTADTLSISPDENTAGEPRDRVEFHGRAEVRPLPVGLEVLRASMAGIRAIQIAGALASVLSLTASYVQEREQFGRPIAKFQAVQQALAEVAGQVATVQAASRLVPWGFGREDSIGLLAAAKIRAGEAVGPVSRIAHQAHGAIGFTQEYALQRFTRRLWGWRDDVGSDAWWARRLGAALAREGADALWPIMTEGLRFTSRTAVF